MTNPKPSFTEDFVRGSDGQPIKTIKNLVLFFRVDENLKGLFHYNEFSASFEYAKNFQWPEHNKAIPNGKRIEDEDIVSAQYYLAHNKQFEMTIEKIRNAITETACRTSYHPVREYLDRLIWDKTPRLDEWLIKGCGADDNIYTREIGRKWLTAAVARIYYPGLKFDHVLVLEGKENIGKSTALRTIGDPWFTDSINLQQKEQDIVAKMTGNWIIELAEMRGLSKADQLFVKGFLSCQSDEQRLAYRRDAKKYPRQSVFAGTSNNMAYLLDEDGNRRFWPIKCEKIDIKWIKQNREQLLAEAKNIWDVGVYPFTDEGEKLFLEGESLEIAKGFQKMRLGTDEAIEEVIDRYLVGKDETTMREIFVDCLQYNLKDLGNRSQVSIIGRVLKRLGFEKKERTADDGSKFKYIREIIKTQNGKLSEEEW